MKAKDKWFTLMTIRSRQRRCVINSPCIFYTQFVQVSRKRWISSFTMRLQSYLGHVRRSFRVKCGYSGEGQLTTIGSLWQGFTFYTEIYHFKLFINPLTTFMAHFWYTCFSIIFQSQGMVNKGVEGYAFNPQISKPLNCAFNPRIFL